MTFDSNSRDETILTIIIGSYPQMQHYGSFPNRFLQVWSRILWNLRVQLLCNSHLLKVTPPCFSMEMGGYASNDMTELLYVHIMLGKSVIHH